MKRRLFAVMQGWMAGFTSLMGVRRLALASVLALQAFMAETVALPLGTAAANPPPGCLYQSANWFDPCSGVSPWLQQNGSNWSPVDGIPGMYGPHGYTPRCDSVYCR